jgi:hypothetical protein
LKGENISNCGSGSNEMVKIDPFLAAAHGYQLHQQILLQEQQCEDELAAAAAATAAGFPSAVWALTRPLCYEAPLRRMSKQNGLEPGSYLRSVLQPTTIPGVSYLKTLREGVRLV